MSFIENEDDRVFCVVCSENKDEEQFDQRYEEQPVCLECAEKQQPTECPKCQSVNVGDVIDDDITTLCGDCYATYDQLMCHLQGHETIQCPNHEGAFDCGAFCSICAGNQEYCPICEPIATE